MTSMRETFVETTGSLLQDDPRLAVVLADISVGLFREQGILERHPDRVINVGIREQLMVGIAAGLALEGFRPIAHTYAPFLVERPFEQLKLDFSHQGVEGIFVSVGGSFDAASSGRTHQAPGDVALLRTLPGFRIFVPGHPEEADLLLRHAADSAGSAYLRLTDDANAEARPISPAGLDVVRRGGAESPTVVAVGPMLDPVAEAVADLDATLLYCTTVRPLDAATLREVATGSEVVLVEPYLEGTSMPELTSALGGAPRRFLSVGMPAVEHRHYGTPAEHRRAHGLDASSLRRRIEGFLDPAS